MENSAMKAIMIGAALFITMITITAVMMYFNSAKSLVENVGDGSSISNNYSTYIRDLILTNGNLTGSDVKNIINYFYDNTLTEVNISIRRNFSVEDVNQNVNLPVSYSNINNDSNNYNKVMVQILDNSKFNVQYELYSDSNEVKSIKIDEII